MKNIIKLLFTVLIFSNCSDQTPAPSEFIPLNTDYIIFGHFYGMCGGEECIEIFKATSTSLYEDSNDSYPNSNQIYDGEFKKLDQSKFDKIKGISFEIPIELLNETETVIGAPDAADGGGIYLQLSNGQYWLLDMNENYLPEYLHPLQKNIRTAIAEINN